MLQKIKAAISPLSPISQENSLFQKALCVIPFLGDVLSFSTQVSLEKQIAATQDLEKQREFRRIQNDYAIADSFRYVIYGILLIRWYSKH